MDFKILMGPKFLCPALRQSLWRDEFITTNIVPILYISYFANLLSKDTTADTTLTVSPCALQPFFCILGFACICFRRWFRLLGFPTPSANWGLAGESWSPPRTTRKTTTDTKSRGTTEVRSFALMISESKTREVRALAGGGWGDCLSVRVCLLIACIFVSMDMFMTGKVKIFMGSNPAFSARKAGIGLKRLP